MKPVTLSGLAILSMLVGPAAIGADVTTPRCPDGYDRHRQPFYGDLHVHTNNSIDAFVFDVTNGPRDAYRFARGESVNMTPIDLDHVPTRTWKLKRPLDFTAVTDHSEGFGITKVCTTPGTLAYDLPECQVLRGIIPRSDLPNPNDVQFTAHRAIGQATLLFLIAQVGVVPPNQPTTCRVFPAQCDAGAVSIWQDTQNAAMQYNDPCHFTTFVGYEWTPMPGTANLHRNVIFRNENVPGKAISYYDTVAFDPRVLWKMLGDACLDPQFGVPGCDVLTIPHNSNLSAGLMFPDPHDAKEAADRAVWEPLVEITQHKGQSECRFDRMFGSGVDTTDELCAFEQENSLTLLPNQYAPVGPPPQLFSPRAFIRSTLKAGIQLEQRGFHDPANPGGKLHINPFKLGVIGSTDTHNGTPGNVDEVDWPGHAGNQDDTDAKRMGGGFTARGNPGGLAVAWAEENTRDSIFDAFRRRETYGTSGTRPTVRFFGGWELGDETSCGDPNLVEVGYNRGVPMGGDLPPPPPGKKPQFIAWAMKDEGVLDESDNLVPGTGTALQRIQIIKGWVDAAGKTHESVLNVAPRKADGSLRSDDSFAEQVNPQTCQAPSAGSSELCTVWEDDAFDPSQPAFYYARVLEDPTCRWSTYSCRNLGVDPFAEGCLVTALTAKPGSNLTDCCAERLDPTVQERAWTSPIWYKPAS